MRGRLFGTVTLALILAACTPPSPDSAQSKRAFKPLDPASTTFWDRQTTETADLLASLATEFNKTNPGPPIDIVQSGGYRDIYLKVTAGIQAGQLPAMAVAYESMTAEYAKSGAVVALDDIAHDPKTGLAAADWDDFFPSVIETNVFPDLGGKMYSFPFSKSVLMLYFNKRVLAAAGHDAPPRTWDEFLGQCRDVKATTGKFALAVNIDASTVDGIIYSLGGELLDGRKSLFDSPAAIKAFELIEALGKEELAYQIPPKTFNDESDFAQDKVAFTMRTSAGRPSLARLMEAPDAWGMSLLPQADPERPRTVLFGSNICIFDIGPAQRDAAWAFVKYFTSRDVSVRWALATGYLPLRKSAANHPDMNSFWAEWPYNRAAFDGLAYARPEPNIVGWQEVRDLIEQAETAVLSGMMGGREAALKLKQDADRVLAGN